MNKTFLVTIAAVILGHVAFTTEAYSVTRTVLPNGLIILTKPVTTNTIVSVVVFLKMGSLYETDDKAGLSTLMQDTLQKGTTTRTSDQIALELESMGTRLSTSSGREYGTVEIQSTSESLNRSLEILFDLLRNANFPTDALELQKRLQVQNILMKYDQPLYRAIDIMVEVHYGKHPFHKPSLGYPETIKTLSRDDVLALYKEVYIPNNMVISVVGNFNEKDFIKEISSVLGPLPRSPEPAKVPVEDNTFNTRTTSVEKTETRDTAASWFVLGWPAPGLMDHDYYATEVLDSITGGSMNSRLFIAIREKRGLAYQVSSFYNARVESGIYVAYIGTKPETYKEAKQVLLDEVKRIGKEESSDEEIDFAKSFLKGMNTMSMESNSGQASQYGLYELLGVGHTFVETYNDHIDKVTAGDILKIGKTYLLDNYALGAVLAK